MSDGGEEPAVAVFQRSPRLLKTSMTTAVMLMICKYLCGLLLSFNASYNILTHVLLFEFITTDLLKMSGMATA